MAEDIPAGWYPDAHGTIRWWDGRRWTDHVREGSRAQAAPREPIATEPAIATPTAAEPAVAQSAAAGPGLTEPTVEPDVTPESGADSPAIAPAAIPSWATTPTNASTSVLPAQQPERHGSAPDIHRPATRISYPPSVEEDIEDDSDSGSRRVWLTATAVGLATFFLGMGLGGQSAQPRQTSDPLPPAVASEPADIEALRQQLANRQAELDERQQVLDEREDELDRRGSESPSPSPSPSDSPSPSATATTIDGDDTVQVGTDVREGTYRTNGPSDVDFECEYVISRDEFGDDVISEDQATSAASVTLRDGDWFETDDCEDWRRE